MDEWQSVALGEVLREDRDRVVVEPNGEYQIAGVLIAGQGLFRRQTIDGSATKYGALYRLRAGQLVYRKLTAWEGPITVVPSEFDGAFVSSEFPTFTLDQSRVLPAFLRLVCQQPAFHEEMRVRSTGTAERRNRLTPDELLEIEVELPPLEEQRAIVDCVAATDRVIAASAEELLAVRRLLRAKQRDIDERGFDTQEVVDCLTDIQAGKSPKCEDRAPGPDEWGVLKVSAIREGRFIPLEAKRLPPEAEPFKRAEVRPGDVLVSRANTSDLVGAACRVAETPSRLLLSDKTLRLIVNTKVIDADYLVEALALPSVREQIEEAAVGSSASMKNISQDSLRAIAIPLPPQEEQRRLASHFGAIRRLMNQASAALHACRQLRSSLIEELLSGVRRVPN